MIIVDHFGFIISPPEVVVAGSILLRPFVSQYDLLATVTFLGVIRKFEFFLKTNGCLFLDKKVRIHLAPTEEQSSSSSGRRIRTFFTKQQTGRTSLSASPKFADTCTNAF
jgi:hypothetical protein